MSQLGRAAPPAPAPPLRAVRADPIAAVLLLLAGAMGIWQLLLPWLTVGPGSGVPGGSPTGWRVYRALRALPAPAPELSWATLSVLGCAVGGGALIVLGLAMMAPLNHRPLGAAALLISLLSAAGALWVVVHARAVFDLGVFGLFGQAGAGWYLFLGSGLLGLAGSWKALSTC
ncbi:MAG TPA: hypothetical protein VIU11_04045 [Nakamurella sp.]